MERYSAGIDRGLADALSQVAAVMGEMTVLSILTQNTGIFTGIFKGELPEIMELESFVHAKQVVFNNNLDTLNDKIKSGSFNEFKHIDLEPVKPGELKDQWVKFMNQVQSFPLPGDVGVIKGLRDPLEVLTILKDSKVGKITGTKFLDLLGHLYKIMGNGPSKNIVSIMRSQRGIGDVNKYLSHVEILDKSRRVEQVPGKKKEQETVDADVFEYYSKNLPQWESLAGSTPASMFWSFFDDVFAWSGMRGGDGRRKREEYRKYKIDREKLSDGIEEAESLLEEEKKKENPDAAAIKALIKYIANVKKRIKDLDNMYLDDKDPKKDLDKQLKKIEDSKKAKELVLKLYEKLEEINGEVQELNKLIDKDGVEIAKILRTGEADVQKDVDKIRLEKNQKKLLKERNQLMEDEDFLRKSIEAIQKEHGITEYLGPAMKGSEEEKELYSEDRDYKHIEKKMENLEKGIDDGSFNLEDLLIL